VKLARLRKPKIVYSASYADFRLKTNAVILLDMVTHLGENTYRRNREREGNLKLESVLCAHCTGVNKVMLNWQRPLWECDWEVVKRSGTDKPIWVVIHMCMKQCYESLRIAYLYLNLAKMLCLSYYLLCFLFKKIGEEVLLGSKGVRDGGSGGEGGSNNVYTYE
jgi:hypothetical protein